MPTDSELDKDLASSPNGTSMLDQLGTRFTTTKDKKAVWETAEIIHLQAGDTLVFSPSWYHRIPPQSKDAAYSAMSIVIKHKAEPTYEGAFQVIPRGGQSFDTHKAACYKLIDLYRELSNPNLDTKNGLPRFHCDASRLHAFKEHEFANHKDHFIENAVLHQDEL
jgi:hypothetical protein